MVQNGNYNITRGHRVNLSFNSEQIKLIENLVGEMGDDKADVVKTIFLNYLSEKNITTNIINKKLNLR